MGYSTRGKAILCAIAAVIAIAAISVVVWYFIRPNNIVTSTFTNSGPHLDGKGTDAAWGKAEAKIISLSNEQDSEIKSVYSADKVFFLIKFKSPKPSKTEQAWTFNGKKWQRGPEGDRAAIFFVMNDSIPEFKNKGFDIMNIGLKKGGALMTVGIAGPTNQDARWSSINQQADYWLWGAAMSNPWGKAADLYYSINREYRLSPTTTMPRLVTQWDAFAKTGIVRANTAMWRDAVAVSEGNMPQSSTSDGPIYMYKQGKNFQNNPYPVLNDLRLIPPGEEFNKGDQLPFIYFSDQDKGLWGASRDDVDARGVWKDGYWTVELSRLLNTEHTDDIKFVPSKTKDVDYSFGLLTRVSDKVVNKSVPAVLRFSPKGDN